MLCRARQLKQFQLGEYSSDNDTVLRAGHAPLNAQTATRPMCRGRPDRAGFGALYRIEEHIQSGWVVHIVGNGVVPSAFEVSKFRAYLRSRNWSACLGKRSNGRRGEQRERGRP
ncbi:hypothetical protein LMG28727_05579 [Paraburkholderia kirstenboschensis]|nr:hypothetical protein LMG28727_05579 [Paraburkholderia kirstenboschensis]